jgi:hypothetical protein
MRHPPRLHDLTVKRPCRAVVADEVAASDQRNVVVDIATAADLHRMGVDADLLQQLASRRKVVRLTARHHSADGQVPPPGPQVLGLAATVYQESAHRIDDGDEYRTMLEALVAHDLP